MSSSSKRPRAAQADHQSGSAKKARKEKTPAEELASIISPEDVTLLCDDVIFLPPPQKKPQNWNKKFKISANANGTQQNAAATEIFWPPSGLHPKTSNCRWCRQQRHFSGGSCCAQQCHSHNTIEKAECAVGTASTTATAAKSCEFHFCHIGKAIAFHFFFFLHIPSPFVYFHCFKHEKSC